MVKDKTLKELKTQIKNFQDEFKAIWGVKPEVSYDMNLLLEKTD